MERGKNDQETKNGIVKKRKEHKGSKEKKKKHE